MNFDFPTIDQIPEEYKITTPVEQKVYLTNGELIEWK